MNMNSSRPAVLRDCVVMTLSNLLHLTLLCSMSFLSAVRLAPDGQQASKQGSVGAAEEGQAEGGHQRAGGPLLRVVRTPRCARPRPPPLLFPADLRIIYFSDFRIFKFSWRGKILICSGDLPVTQMLTEPSIVRD